MKTVYDAMIRPVLENASPAWNPYYQKDINKLETKTEVKKALRRSRPAD